MSTRLSIAAAAVLIVVGTPVRAQCPITTVSGTVVENFSDATDQAEGSTLLGWGTGTAPFSLRLPQHRDLTGGVSGRLSDRLIAVVAGNFDRDPDGYDDLIALVHEINPVPVGGMFKPDRCELRFYRNLGMSGSTHLGFAKGVELYDVTGHVLRPPHCDEEGAGLHIGDIDGDGAMDLLFYTVDNIHSAGTPSRSSGYRLWLARNCSSGVHGPGKSNCSGTVLPPGTPPVFSQLQGTVGPNAPDEAMAWHWGADPVQLVSWNDDAPDPNGVNIYNRWDLLWSRSSGSDNQVLLYYACKHTNVPACPNSQSFGNAYGFGFNWRSSGSAAAPDRQILLTDAGFTGPFASAGNTAALSAPCGNATYSLGITVNLAADFDNDGDYDLILGSMSEHHLRYFENTGSNEAPIFTPGTETVIPFDKGGPAYGVAVDYDRDGFPDLAIATDRYSCGGGDGKLWVLPNNGSGSFVTEPIAIADMGDDVDWLIDLDANGDGYRDLMVGQNVERSPYFLTLGQPINVYRSRGVAISNPVDLGTLLDPTTDTLTQVTVSSITTSGPSGTLTMWLSNNDGQTWEEVSSDEMPPSSKPHAFKSFGTKLRWKLQVEHEEPLSGPNSRYAPGATQTPEISQLELSWTATTERFRHSASGLAYGSLDHSGSEREFLFVASTLYPDLAGTVQAYEITDCTSFATGSVESEACVTSPWSTDAGAQLQNRTGSSRVVYTAHDAGSGRVDTRLTLSTPLTPALESVLGTTDDDDWRFVRDGMTLSGGTEPKLREIGHSTPVFVGPPGDPNELVCLDPEGTLGFSTFAANQASRQAMVYVGSNGGTLHAFNALSGNEEWAFVPHNLAQKLQSQRGDDNVYRPGFFVDGPLVVRDVYDSTSSRWRTILIGGQGRGAGLGDENYYFALDITNPADPQPLWEFSDPWALNTGGTCDGNPCDWVCSRSCPSVACSSDCSAALGQLTSSASPGDTSIRIIASQWSNFPATGTVEIDRFGGNPEVRFYTKTAPDRLNLLDEAGNPHGLSTSYPWGTVVVQSPTYIFQETNGIIAFEAERYHQTRTIDGMNYWATQFSDWGYSGTGYINAVSASGHDTGINCHESSLGTCGTTARYTLRFDRAGTWNLYARVSYDNSDDDSFHWGIDNAFVQRNRHVSWYGTWHWIWGHSGSSASSPAVARVHIPGPGLHTFNIWMRESDAHIDRFIMVPEGSPAPSGSEPDTCEQICTPQECAETCTLNCIGDPSNEDWPECGPGKKCCQVPGNPNQHFCAPTSSSCTEPDTVMGETWSPPAVGQFLIQGQPRWVVVFASGYNNRNHFNAGRSVYAVDAITGEQLGRWDTDDLPTSGSNPSTIDNTIPGGVTLLDMDSCEGANPDAGCGFVDRIYFGDLEGRLWKIDTSSDASLDGDGLVSHASWPMCVLYDAGDEENDGSRIWAPIITRPGVAVLEPETVNVYFGTGGDDRAPGTELYRFYSVRDTSVRGSTSCSSSSTLQVTDLSHSEAEWIIGDGRLNDGDPVGAGTLFGAATPPLPADFEGTAGDRYWTDPIIINGLVVVFASVTGKLDSLDPCENLEGTSDIYAYAIRNFRDSNGQTYRAGDRYLKVTGLGKIRQSAVIRGTTEGAGFNVYGNCGVAQNTPLRRSEGRQVFLPTTSDPTDPSGGGKTQVLSDPIAGFRPQNSLKILRWREIPL